GLLMRSFVNLSRTDIGFAPGQLHAVELQLPRGRYRAPQEPVRFFEALVDRLRALPGVQAVGATSIAPLGNGDRNFSFHKEGEPPPDRPTGNGPALWHRQVTPDYFAAMRIALRAGRVFTREDGAESPAVAVINEAAAHQYWPGRSAVGERIYIDGPGGGSEPATIVGVVANVRHDGQSAPVKPEVFVPLAQSPARGMTVMVRGAGDPVALSSAVRGAIRELDRAIPVGPVTPMVSRYAESVALPRLFTWLFAAFGAAALALASVGIYGVVSYGVATRRREFGVRMAVGAEPSRILAMVLRQGAALALAGAAAGVLGSIAAGRAVRALLVGVGAADPASLTMATLTLLAVGACAVLIPARRAMRTDPVAALRSG
ncbi:MAG TPA: ABC transporter permease, partial [Gemmatimonadaceae bacterium]|nr:ABC transporter permease [Gemmatimonadaceae bacterium]